MRATATEVAKIRAESNVSRSKHHVYPSGGLLHYDMKYDTFTQDVKERKEVYSWPCNI